jgi:hypothetical protein
MLHSIVSNVIWFALYIELWLSVAIDWSKCVQIHICDMSHVTPLSKTYSVQLHKRYGRGVFPVLSYVSFVTNPFHAIDVHWHLTS